MKQKTNFQILMNFLKGCKLIFLAYLITFLIRTGCEMLFPQIVRITIDNIYGGAEANLPSFVMDFINGFGGFAYFQQHIDIVALVVLAIALVQSVSQYGGMILNRRFAAGLTRNMRNSLFEHIQKLPYEWHAKNHTGDIIQRCTSDVTTLQNFISEQLTSLVLLALKIGLGVYCMFAINVKLALIATACIPIIVIYTVIFSKDMTKGFHKCDEMEGVVSSMVQENLTGVRVVRAFGQEAKEKDRFEKKNQEYTELWWGMGKIMGRFWSIQDVLCFAQSLLVMIFGAKYCISGEMLTGELVSFFTYEALLNTPIRRVGRVISEMSKAGVAIDRISYVMNSEPEKEKEDAVYAPMDKDICFNNVSFSYGEDLPNVLSGVSFSIPAGSTLGILGGTGSGKSTLMLLLDKMYELSEGQGSITIGGVDIKDINTKWLRKNISMVLQEPHLYSRSIAENIKISDDNLTMEDIKLASESACLNETVEKFTNGYDTFVGERGVTLSGGQKQRTAIARALIRKAPIFVFDDSLSAVDTQTDAKIREELSKRFGSATTIIISHRITSLSKADKVLVMEDGKVLEFGTPEELKCSGGLYNKIYDIQSGKA